MRRKSITSTWTTTAAMKDDRGGLPPNLSHDGVHPNPAGFALMAPLVEAGIEKALNAGAEGGMRDGKTELRGSGWSLTAPLSAPGRGAGDIANLPKTP